MVKLEPHERLDATRLNRILVLNYSCYRSMLLEHSWFSIRLFSRFGSRGGSLFCSSYCTEVKTKRRPPLSLFIPLFRKRRRQKDANISTKGEVLLHGGLEETVICRIQRMSLPICNSVMVNCFWDEKTFQKSSLWLHTRTDRMLHVNQSSLTTGVVQI